MATLKGSETFVAETLIKYYKNQGYVVKCEEGNDPPDIFLTLNREKISVEISDIEENLINNRKSLDRSYLTFIKNLYNEFGKSIPKHKSILILFFHNYLKVSTINKPFKKYFKSLLNSYSNQKEIQSNIKNVNFKIIFFNTPKNKSDSILGGSTSFGKKIKRKSRDINTVLNQIHDGDVVMKTTNILIDRISDKNKKCLGINNPIYLALYDNYFHKFTNYQNNEHIEHYKNVMDNIEIKHNFEKILVVFQNQDVLEFISS